MIPVDLWYHSRFPRYRHVTVFVMDLHVHGREILVGGLAFMLRMWQIWAKAPTQLYMALQQLQYVHCTLYIIQQLHCTLHYKSVAQKNISKHLKGRFGSICLSVSKSGNNHFFHQGKGALIQPQRGLGSSTREDPSCTNNQIVNMPWRSNFLVDTFKKYL